MATSPAFDFATEFSAHMLGMTSETYVDGMKTTLGMLDEIEDAIKRMKIKSEDDFKQAYGIKGRLNSLSCYTFNNKLPENDRVWQLEMNLGKKISRWTKSQLADSEDSVLIRYILWNKRYLRDTEWRKKILDRLLEKGYVFILPSDNDNEPKFVLTGVHYKIGDNTFTIDGYRRYYPVCTPQCFELIWDMDYGYLRTKDVPTINREVSLTPMDGLKGSALCPRFTTKDRIKLGAWLKM